MTMTNRLLPCVLLAAMTLSACEASDNDPGVGGVTAGEARALNEAAEMLDAQTDALPHGDQAGNQTQSEAPPAAEQAR